jgi:hypothetical protein
MDISKKSRVVYGFWMGGTPCSIRQQTLDELPLYFENLGITFTLITPANIDLYVEQAGEKLHEGFQYLSAVHKSDYLRCYFMHFLGGGYIDIKPPGAGWNKAFDKLETTDSYYAVSQHIGPADISAAEEWGTTDPRDIHRITAYKKYKINYLKIMAQAALICKPKTLFTEEWYNSLQTKMDTYLPALKENPAQHARDRRGGGFGYPIEWAELLSEIFFPACCKHSRHLGFLGDQQFRDGILPSQIKDFLSNRLLKQGCLYADKNAKTIFVPSSLT